eukprot:5486927-Alexandrium_andersonii.AAC.1
MFCHSCHPEGSSHDSARAPDTEQEGDDTRKRNGLDCPVLFGGGHKNGYPAASGNERMEQTWRDSVVNSV